MFFLIIPWCIWFQVSYSVYQFTGGGNDSNFNTQWLQRHYLYQTVMKEESNNKPFVKSNLVGYESHNTNSIPKQLIKNNAREHK
jgi:predicted acyl esterase